LLDAYDVLQTAISGFTIFEITVDTTMRVASGERCPV